MRNATIDRLRTLMMCLVMFGHAMLPYVTIPRRFNDASATIAFDMLGILLYAFAMPAFFVTAGFSAAALLAHKGTRVFWSNRFYRIGIPLLLGYLLLTPLTRAAYQFASAASTSGLAAGYASIITFDWVRWSKLYHLWFLATLILFSVIAFCVVRVLQRFNPRLRETFAKRGSAMSQPGRSYLWMLLIAAIPSTLSYISGTGQGTDAWIQIMLLFFFAGGWWLQQYPEQIRGIRITQSRYWLTLAVAIPVCVWSSRERLFEEHESDLAMGLLAGTSSAAIGVAATFLLLGLFRHEDQRQRPIIDYLGAASYWIYLVHYPIVVFAGGLVSVLAWSAGLKYIVTLVIAVPVVLLSFEPVRRRQARRKQPHAT